MQLRSARPTVFFRYKGSHKRGMKHGRGTFFFHNGDSFKGTFRCGIKHGPGGYLWADGDRFEATFVDGKEQGRASFLSTDGRIVCYYFESGKEVPPPQDETKQEESAETIRLKCLSLK